MRLTEEQISNFGLTWGLSLFIGLMLLIIWDLARKSNAGKFGTMILFIGLAMETTSSATAASSFPTSLASPRIRPVSISDAAAVQRIYFQTGIIG